MRAQGDGDDAVAHGTLPRSACGVLSCYDRIVITGTLPGACYAAGMTSFLNAKGIRIFDHARFVEPLRERIRARAHALCAQAGIEIEHIAKSHIRKEEVVAKVLARRGEHARLGACHLGHGSHEKSFANSVNS